MSASVPTVVSSASGARVVTGTVQIGKPIYLSKKVWLAVIGLVVALYVAITGKSETVPEALALISKVASVLGVVVPLILAVAHVDGKERDLVAAVLATAKTLAVPDPDEVTPVAPPAFVPSSGPGPSVAGPFDVPGLSSSKG